jgi:hypothetical protein
VTRSSAATDVTEQLGDRLAAAQVLVESAGSDQVLPVVFTWHSVVGMTLSRSPKPVLLLIHRIAEHRDHPCGASNCHASW